MTVWMFISCQWVKDHIAAETHPGLESCGLLRQGRKNIARYRVRQWLCQGNLNEASCVGIRDVHSVSVGDRLLQRNGCARLPHRVSESGGSDSGSGGWSPLCWQTWGTRLVRNQTLIYGFLQKKAGSTSIWKSHVGLWSSVLQHWSWVWLDARETLGKWIPRCCVKGVIFFQFIWISCYKPGDQSIADPLK